MSERLAHYDSAIALVPNDKVRVAGPPELGVGEVLRIAETAGFYQADVVFETPGGRRLEVFPVELLEKTSDLWQRLKERSVCTCRRRKIGFPVASVTSRLVRRIITRERTPRWSCKSSGPENNWSFKS